KTTPNTVKKARAKALVPKKRKMTTLEKAKDRKKRVKIHDTRSKNKDRDNVNNKLETDREITKIPKQSSNDIQTNMSELSSSWADESENLYNTEKLLFQENSTQNEGHTLNNKMKNPTAASNTSANEIESGDSDASMETSLETRRIEDELNNKIAEE
ncbi:11312_t:CDS:1, partial [Cetraspora pellucida]